MSFSLATKRTKAIEDTTGDVRVSITRINRGAYVKGNIAKGFVLENGSVSEVHQWLQDLMDAEAEEEAETDAEA